MSWWSTASLCACVWSTKSCTNTPPHKTSGFWLLINDFKTAKLTQHKQLGPTQTHQFNSNGTACASISRGCPSQTHTRRSARQRQVLYHLERETASKLVFFAKYWSVHVLIYPPPEIESETHFRSLKKNKKRNQVFFLFLLHSWNNLQHHFIIFIGLVNILLFLFDSNDPKLQEATHATLVWLCNKCTILVICELLALRITNFLQISWKTFTYKNMHTCINNYASIC